MDGQIIIFGGGGFIGHNLSNILSSDSQLSVIVIGRSMQPKFYLNEKVQYVQAVNNNRAQIIELIKNSDYLIDLTYSTVPKTSFDDPLIDINENIPSIVTLLKLAVGSKLKKYLLISSGGTVYGEPHFLPINEKHPTEPISPYGISKLMAEKYANFYHQVYDVPVVILRPSNPYGIEQVSNSPQGFIGNVVFALNNNQPIQIFGRSGTIRDYIHIDDLVKGVISVLQCGVVGGVYNLGSGVGINNIHIADIIIQSFDLQKTQVCFEYHDSRPFDVSSNILDCSKLKKLSGWEAKMNIEDGICDVIAQFQR